MKLACLSGKLTWHPEGRGEGGEEGKGRGERRGREEGERGRKNHRMRVVVRREIGMRGRRGRGGEEKRRKWRGRGEE